MDSILTASETLAFRTFLSQVNYDSALVDSLVASADWSSLGDAIIPVPHAAPGKEALAKATKDLMSLPAPAAPPSPAPQLLASFQGWHDALRARSSGTGAVVAPRAESSSSQSLLGDVSPRTPSSPAALPPSSSSSSSAILSNPATAKNNKRALPASSSSPPAPKRARSGTSASVSARSATTQQSSSSNASASTSTSTKPALLTPSQKKANHIQSEQKRRANIRRGYEALCETVPALVDAIRAEDAAAGDSGAGAGGSRNGGGGSGAGSGGGAKRRRGRGAREQQQQDADKADGRAGPRSENVVLGKTVEHIQDLLAQREALLARLARARSMLPPDHAAQPQSHPDTPPPLWEREWAGGEAPEGEGEGESDDD